jgi:glycosyltransferase involved in cell wall biosynthesis
LHEVAGSLVGDGRVRFLGSISDVRTLLWASDVVVCTSRTEGMPGVLIEAGLSGVPVVATDVGAVRWMMRTGVVSGEVVPATVSTEKLAKALERAVKNNSRPPAATSVCTWGSVSAMWADELESHLATGTPTSEWA